MNARDEKAEFVAALEKFAEGGRVSYLLGFYKDATHEEDKQLIEGALIHGIGICGDMGQMQSIVSVYTSGKNLSDAILMEIIGACEKNLWDEVLNSMYLREDISDAVLMRVIGAFEKNHRYGHLHAMSQKEHLSDEVREAAAAAAWRVEKTRLAGFMAAVGGSEKAEAPALSKPPQETVREYLRKRAGPLSDGDLQRPQPPRNGQAGAQAKEPQKQPDRR